jgi:hypothetical protein
VDRITERGKNDLATWPPSQPHAVLDEFNAALFENVQHATTMFFPHFVGGAWAQLFRTGLIEALDY